MENFENKIAVITGAGSGIGRELALLLTSHGCHVAMCDIMEAGLLQTADMCRQRAPGVNVSTYVCDVSVESQVSAFCAAVKEAHGTQHVNLLFNNAGIGGGNSFLVDRREDWERTFAVNWQGVYHCTRHFAPLLVASDDGYLVNISSINGLWAHLGPNQSHSAYSSAKFAVRGFTESLITDFRVNAPHVRVALVLPGHVASNIPFNTLKVLGKPSPKDMPPAEVARVRAMAAKQGMPLDGLTNDQIRQELERRDTLYRKNFQERAPLTARAAAGQILDGMRRQQWRILVGGDAQTLDQKLRDSPDDAYSPEFLADLHRQGHFTFLAR